MQLVDLNCRQVSQKMFLGLWSCLRNPLKWHFARWYFQNWTSSASLSKSVNFQLPSSAPLNAVDFRMSRHRQDCETKISLTSRNDALFVFKKEILLFVGSWLSSKKDQIWYIIPLLCSDQQFNLSFPPPTHTFCVSRSALRMGRAPKPRSCCAKIS